MNKRKNDATDDVQIGPRKSKKMAPLFEKPQKKGRIKMIKLPKKLNIVPYKPKKRDEKDIVMYARKNNEDDEEINFIPKARKKSRAADEDEDMKVESDDEKELKSVDMKMMRNCPNVLDISELLQARAACIFEYLSKTRHPYKKIATFLILPAILSFNPTPYFRKMFKIILTGITRFFQDKKNKETFNYPSLTEEEIQVLGASLLELNEHWNSQMDVNKRQYVEENIHLENGLGDELTLLRKSVKFYQQVFNLGEMFEEKYSNYYADFKDNKMVLMDNEQIQTCNQTPKDMCEKSGVCKVRFSKSEQKWHCFSREKIRSIKEGGYYIFVDGNTQSVYKTIKKSVVSAGDVYIFHEHAVENETIIPTNNYVVIFPPFQQRNFGDVGNAFYNYMFRGLATVSHKNSDVFNIPENVSTSLAFYKEVRIFMDENIRIFKNIKKNPNAEIIVIGISMGGSYANILAFLLVKYGYKNIHLYACGSPRVGNQGFNTFMTKAYAEGRLSKDSGNYIKSNTFIEYDQDKKLKRFVLQYDPIAKFPTGYADNPLLKAYGEGFLYNPLVFGEFKRQSDYHHSVFPLTEQFSKLINLNFSIGKNIFGVRTCKKKWGDIHSVGAYGFSNIMGMEPMVDKVIDIQHDCNYS